MINNLRNLYYKWISHKNKQSDMEKGIRIVFRVNEYRNAIREIESPFKGLPYGSLILIKELISLADPKTGIVTNISYNELAVLLAIKPSPGRKNSGAPTKQTIRNHIKSLEKEFYEFFKVISDGQKLQFLFPEVPRIIGELIKSNELNTESKLEEFIENKEENDFSYKHADTEVNIELNTPTNAVKNIINNINNNNNNKQSISENFTPNTETIARAEALGYSNASDVSEIQAFIDYNKATGSQFVDFNPIYLRWLAKSIERQKTNKQLSNTGSITHAKQHSLRTQTHQSTLRERVLKAHANDFTLCEETEYFDSSQKSKQWDYGAFVVEVN